MISGHEESRPLSNVDAAWLQMDDRTNLMTITGVMSFYEKLDFDRLKSVVEDRFICYDRMRQRVVKPRVPFANPRWQDDPHFNLKAHLLRVALPDPGGKQEMQEMVSNLMSTPLDFSKPLWQFQYIENYQGGSAIVARIHHCIADGIALVRVMLGMTDDAPDPQPRRRPRSKPRAASGFWLPEVVNDALYSVRKLTGTLVEEGVETILQPDRAAELANQTADVAGVLGRLLTMPYDPATVFSGRLGVAKRCAWSDVMPLDRVKALGKKLGGTINDLLLSGVTGALRRYIEGRNEETYGLDIRAVIPVNLRPDDAVAALGNRFGLVFLALPIGIVDQVERLQELKRRMDALKSSSEAVVAFGLLNALGMASPEIESLAVSILGKKATAVMTNVPGPKEEIFLAGKAVRSIMFWVPQSGKLGLGVSIISYAGQVRLGVTTDAGLVPDPQTVIDAFHDELESMMKRYL
jgi:WS/DGAT/MGAT family acyltransferase